MQAGCQRQVLCKVAKSNLIHWKYPQSKYLGIIVDKNTRKHPPDSFGTPYANPAD